MSNKLSVNNAPAFIEKFTSAGWSHEVEVRDYIYRTSTLHTLSFSVVSWYGSVIWYTVFVDVINPTPFGRERHTRASVKVWSISHYAPKSVYGTWNAGYYLKQSKEETEAIAQKKAEKAARLAENPVV